MAAPFPGSPEAVVIEKLRAERANRAELFFRNAKSLADPVSGFEDADFWSIQALLLMSLYMLAVSKRNACYAYYGENSCLWVITSVKTTLPLPLLWLESNTARRNGCTFSICTGAT